MKLIDWIDQDKLNWWNLSLNPAAIHLLKANQDKINWERLSRNPAAIHLLEANLYKIDCGVLSQNPAIFEKDIKKWKQLCYDFAIKISS